MGWILLALYILIVAALIIGVYNYLIIKELIKSNKFNSKISHRNESRLYSLEKILDNKKWTRK